MIQKEIIKTTHLIKSFEMENGTQTILKGIDLSVYEKDFAVIMGASGSGKSTLLYALSGMDSATSGQIFLDGTDITRLSSDQLAEFRRMNCGFVFQQICLLNSLTVMENVLVAGYLRKNVKRSDLRRKAAELLHQVEIEDHTFQKYPPQISSGRAQRVGIVRALINEPRILFADEPTGALNSKTGKNVLDQFTVFNEMGQTIVMVTHDFKSALRGNRILYLKDGLIVDECSLGRYSEDNKEREKKLVEFLEKMGW